MTLCYVGLGVVVAALVGVVYCMFVCGARADGKHHDINKKR